MDREGAANHGPQSIPRWPTVSLRRARTQQQRRGITGNVNSLVAFVLAITHTSQPAVCRVGWVPLEWRVSRHSNSGDVGLTCGVWIGVVSLGWSCIGAPAISSGSTAQQRRQEWMNMNRTTLGLTNTKLGFGVGGVPREEQGCS